ncbi:ribonucleoside-diphosphate reductase subunit alpha [Candidatus Gracilibacteria bacterium]|nr:ribonucleoside-diphosphate reductase subunit alpha [Candidatus Gracilibacteria bacterium]NUJ98516.1 ribonucleoside-diphosphate reductase subunit alpha [Candidatus Gracilibacteria bacterium]
MIIKFIKNRDGDLIPFDITRIERAIEKASQAAKQFDIDFIDDISQKVVHTMKEILINSEEGKTFHIEEIQDLIEKYLMEDAYYEVAKQYILYRNERTKIREKRKEEAEKKLENKTLKIIKSNGKKESFDREKIKDTYKKISYKLARTCPFEALEESLKKYIVDDMHTSDIINMMIKSSIDLISVENVSWQIIAGRLAIADLYKKASKTRKIEISDIYKGKSYKALFDEYVKFGLYYKDFYKYYSEEDIIQAGKRLNKEADLEYAYTTVLMYKKRYLLNPNKVIKELPQEMYMSIALFLAIPEAQEKRLETAFKIYEYCSEGKISLPTPTLLNARTNYHQLSSCFKLNVDDDLRSIYHNIENMAQISKFGGGIGVYLGNIRSKGGSIRGVKGVSGGVNPWVKVINDTAIAVNQLGARAGAISVTLDVWHRDIYDFLDLQTETGDIRRKAFDIFPSISFPDLFMKRIQEAGKWTLFDPKEVKDVTGKSLQDCFGEEFEKFYMECENNEKLELKEEVPAKDLFKKYLKSTVETGMPYAFFRDTVNKANPNKHAGNVYSTQLCVEICQNTSPTKFVEESIDDLGNVIIKYIPGDSVVCNLASINVAKVHNDEDIKAVVPIVMRLLDNVIDLNFYPIKEAEITAKKYRSVGLGFLGLAEYLAVRKIAYDSAEAREVVNSLFEKFAYETLKSSNSLARERGKYSIFDGSERSKGILLGKDKKWFQENSNMAHEWAELIEKIKKDGLRFAYHLAPAPNTSTALVMGTTASVLPIYKKYFIETNSVAPTVNVAPNLSSDNFWYYKEYVNMNMEDVIDMVSVIYKWIDQSISFEWIINPQKVSPVELYNYYLKAWKQGIKTVYYVRGMSLEVEKCESCTG